MVLSLRLSLAFVLLASACERASVFPIEPEPKLAPVEVEPDDGAVAVKGRAARDAPEQVERDGVVLGLWPDECLLLAETAQTESTAPGRGARVAQQLEFPGACHFALDADGRPRVVVTDTGPAWMIEGSKPLAQDCDTALRVVVLTRAGPRMSKAEQRVAMCAPSEWDEMMFHVLASEPVEFGTPGTSP
jgi:hypothetical protein